MATDKDLRRIALSLDGVTEAPHFDRAAFKVARIFATMPPDGLTANLKLEAGEQELKCLTAPEAFAPVPGGWGRMGWTTVTLGKVRAEELASALTTAWAHAVGKATRRAQ